MKIHILSTLRNYDKNYLKQDIFSGIIIAAVSIPISMGYAQISGLPAVYGYTVLFYLFYYLQFFPLHASLFSVWMLHLLPSPEALSLHSASLRVPEKL